jgi:hypothetical protein
MVSIVPVRHLRDEVLENLFALSRNQRLAHSHCTSRVAAIGKTAVELQRANNLIKSVTVYVGGAVPRPFPPLPVFDSHGRSLGIKGEKPPVTQAKRLRVAADTALISALSQALVSQDVGPNRFL